MSKKSLPLPGELGMGLSLFLSAVAWIVFAFFTLLLFLTGVFIGMPLSLVLDGGTRRMIHIVARLWGRGLIFFCPLWSIHVEGRENIQPGAHYVITANHQSLLDILVVLSGLPVHFKFMAKKELFSIPVMGWHMSLAGYIPIDRGRKESARDAVAAAKSWIHRKVSVLFFPEGTRSQDGEIQAFKAGAFKVAAQERVPILPVIVEGTGDALPKHSWVFRRRSRFRLYIGKPVPALTSDAPEQVEALRENVRAAMIQHLADIRIRHKNSKGVS